MQATMDVMSVRHVAGKKDPTKRFSIINGIVVSEGKRHFVEFFVDECREAVEGQCLVDYELSSTQDHKLTVFVKGVQPVRAKAA
jgi:hypothetical protein